MNRRRLPKEERAARAMGRTKRALVALARVTAALGVAAAVLYGAVRSWQNVKTGGRFTVKHVVFMGNQRSSSEELLTLAGPLEGTNIFTVDLSAAAWHMEQHRWVAHARVARELPDTLRVVIDEREAAALVSAGGLYAVDRAGLPFKSVTTADQLDLPVISGVAREVLTNADGSASSDVLTALKIIDAYQARKIALREPLSEVHVVEEAGQPGFLLYCGESGVEVNLGVLHGDVTRELTAVLDRLERVWSGLDQRGARPRSLDLGNRSRPDLVPARLEASALAFASGSPKR